MNNRMLPKENNLSRCANQPFFIIFLRLLPTHRILIEGKLLHGPADSLRKVGSDIAMIRREANSASFKQCAFEIVEKIRRVLNAYAETDEILGETTLGTGSWVDGCVALQLSELTRRSEKIEGTYDITQGILIKEFTHPKLTLIPQSLVAPTILSLRALSPVVKLNTAPGPSAILSCTSLLG